MNIHVAITATDGNHVPVYATDGAVGADLKAALSEPAVCEPGRMVIIPTGVSMAIPEGVEGQVRPRSGLAFKHGISIVNAPGTIDSDFRGEIKVALINHGLEPFTVNPGDRIAQIVFAPVLRAVFEVTEKLKSTERGEDGFGSTGR